MKTKHTAGPWTIDQYNTIKDTNGNTVRVDGVALSNRSTEESRANCRLVSAAPELLGALQDLANLYDTDEGCRSTPEYINARAAIAKALGEIPKISS